MPDTLFHRPFYDAAGPGLPRSLKRTAFTCTRLSNRAKPRTRAAALLAMALPFTTRDHGDARICQVCGVAPLVDGSGPVEKPHDLYDRDVRLPGAPFEKLQQPPSGRSRSRHGCGRVSGRQGVEAGVE